MEKNNDILIPEFERLIRLGHMVEFTPRGASMLPFIEEGRHKVCLKACKQIKVGIIVLARVGDTYVLHRIYQIKGKKIILQGDGNLFGQEQCYAKDIIARVVMIKTIDGKCKRLTKAHVWRHLPVSIKSFYLKVYRKFVKWFLV